MEPVATWLAPSMSSDRLSHEIFSILESKFLFGSGGDAGGRVRILSIDGGSDGGMLAAIALSKLEGEIRAVSGNPAARVADFFDLAAGSGAGAFLAAALFAGKLSAAEAAEILAKNQRVLSGRRRRGLFCRREGFFRRVLGDSTVRDSAKPLLLPCYDLRSSAPFVFSRADAVEAEAYDFPLWEVCAAACGAREGAVSVDGKTRVSCASGAGAAAAVANPTAVAITHVLHNKGEFPFVAGMGDLLVLSLGCSCAGTAVVSGKRASAGDLMRLASGSQADLVDQAVAMAFGESRKAHYVRIQGNGLAADASLAGASGPEAALAERSVESVLFRGRKLTAETNGDRVAWAAGELAKEQKRRERSKIPLVTIKSAATPPRTSSSSASTLITTSTASSGSP